MSNLPTHRPVSIINALHGSNASRNLHEDSEDPERKLIFCHAKTDKTNEWIIEALDGNGNYLLYCRGAITGSLENQAVCAFLVSAGSANWLITERESGLYTISTSDKMRYWHAVGDKDQNNVVLIYSVTEEPDGSIPRAALWKFEVVDK